MRTAAVVVLEAVFMVSLSYAIETEVPLAVRRVVNLEHLFVVTVER